MVSGFASGVAGVSGCLDRGAVGPRTYTVCIYTVEIGTNRRKSLHPLYLADPSLNSINRCLILISVSLVPVSDPRSQTVKY